MNRRNITIVAVIIVIIAIVSVTAGLIGAQDTNVPTPRHIPGTITNERPIEYQKGKYGGTFVDSIVGEPKTFNLSQSVDGTSSDIIAMFSPGLMTLDFDTGKWEVFLGNLRKGKSGPGYDINLKKSGEMEIIIHLKKGIYWTDGTPMTADDWVWYHNNVEANIDVGTMGYGGTWVELENGDEEQIYAQKIDKLTFKYVIPRVAGEPEIMAGGNIMPRHILRPIYEARQAKGIREMWGIDTDPNDIVGYGPWILQTYSSATGLVFHRNDRYFFKDEWNNPLPYLDKFIMSNVADVQSATLQFKNRQLDTLFIETSAFKEMVEGAESGGYSVWNGGTELYNRFIVFNQNPNSERLKGTSKLRWFQDKDFRFAMSMLIDRESLLAQAYNSLGEPSDGFLPPASPYYDPTNTFKVEYNPEKALRMLEDSVNKIKDRNGDGVMEDKTGVPIEFELLTNSGYGYKEQTVILVAKEWTIYGIKTTPVLLDFNIVTDKISKSYDYDSHYMTLGGSVFAMAINVWPSDGNYHVWHPYQKEPATEWEAEIDYLHNAAMYEPDYEKRKKLWNRMYAILYRELPLIPMVRKYDFQAFYDDWGNIYWDTFASPGESLFMRVYRK
jgi:peptide/nickel transport system substrate-binding protein